MGHAVRPFDLKQSHRKGVCAAIAVQQALVGVDGMRIDVRQFVGDPDRVEALLGWSAENAVENGVRRLLRDFRGFHATRGTTRKAELARI
jgi:hypothetical protein